MEPLNKNLVHWSLIASPEEGERGRERGGREGGREGRGGGGGSKLNACPVLSAGFLL